MTAIPHKTWMFYMHKKLQYILQNSIEEQKTVDTVELKASPSFPSFQCRSTLMAQINRHKGAMAGLWH